MTTTAPPYDADPPEEPDADATGDDGSGDLAAQLQQALQRAEAAETQLVAAQEADERAETAEAALHQTRLRLAFLEANAEREAPFNDVALAYQAADLAMVTFADDGSPSGLTEAMDHLARRYPYLVDDSAVPAATPTQTASTRSEGTPPTSGRSLRRKRQSYQGLDEAALRTRFPALRGR